jgi:UDP-glucose 4-epimerase
VSVLVTGGTGFLGRYIVHALVTQGETVVSYNRDFSVSDRPKVVAVQGELFDIPKLARTLAEHRINRIIHTAAQSHPEISIDLPVTTFAANVDGTLGVFEAARMSPSTRRIVNISSECAYGHQDEESVVRESACPLPNTPYGVTKVAGELLGRVYSSLYDIDVVSLRVSEIYGPGLKMPEVLKDMLCAAMQDVPFRLAEGASHRFQFVHVTDVARAAILASSKLALPQYVYNITGGEQLTLHQLADIIRRNYPNASIDLGSGHLSGWDRQGPFDITAAQRDFGYQPGVSIADGIASYAVQLSHQKAAL